MKIRVLVITSCTGEKVHKPECELLQEDFKDKDRLKRREKELASFQRTAGEMYTGKQHLALMNGIKDYRKLGGQVDVNILSAGYGLLKETDIIVPYEVTFSTMNSLELKSWSSYLNTTSILQQSLEPYDLIFFLLGDKYLQAVDWLTLKTRDDQKLIFFAGESSKSKILIKPNHYILGITEKEAKIFHSGLIEIKGFLFARLLKSLGSGISDWESIHQNPETVRDLVLGIDNQISLFGSTIDQGVDLLAFDSIDIPPHLVAKNYGKDLKYYIPENEDRVDPDFDFIKDKQNRIGDPLDHDVYAHELLGTPSYDGILISKTTIDSSSQQKKFRIKELGIRKFLRLPDDYPIMGDCGAFSYLNEEKPPYDTSQVLEYYHSYGFDYGVSVDHLIVGPYMKNESERNRRYRLTLENARDFITQYNLNKEKEGYRFTPIGIAQGWDPLSFRKAVEELIDMGYNYVALGGLAMEKSLTIIKILKEVAPIIPHVDFRMHLFGVVRDNMKYMEIFNKLGVTSFDSASPLRRAWLGLDHSYYSPVVPEKHYAAIRIPEASPKSPRVKKQVKKDLKKLIPGSCSTESQEYAQFEKSFFKIAKAYDAKEIDLDESVSQVSQLFAKWSYPQPRAEDIAKIFACFQKFKDLEGRAIEALRAYDRGDEDIENALDVVLDYNVMLGEDRERNYAYYRDTLMNQPWKQCDCNICRKIGIDVLIFRGNNRNRRRGFHNTYVFYKQIKYLKKEVLKN